MVSGSKNIIILGCAMLEINGHFPNENTDHIFKYGKYLALHFKKNKIEGNRLKARQFVEECIQALDNMKNGADGFSEVVLPCALVGYPDITYSMLRQRIPEIAKAIFPKEFSDHVAIAYEKIEKERLTAQ